MIWHERPFMLPITLWYHIVEEFWGTSIIIVQDTTTETNATFISRLLPDCYIAMFSDYDDKNCSSFGYDLLPYSTEQTCEANKNETSWVCLLRLACSYWWQWWWCTCLSYQSKILSTYHDEREREWQTRDSELWQRWCRSWYHVDHNTQYNYLNTAITLPPMTYTFYTFRSDARCKSLMLSEDGSITLYSTTMIAEYV